nr:polymer-forming cytoskeletal protein [uncultured Cellulosilyticum sp.]
MENKKLYSVNINGMGKYTGGEFDCVNIAGTGKVEGNVKCNELNVSGTIAINGDLASKVSTVSGTAKVGGDLFGDDLTVSGMLKAIGSGMVKNVTINGMMMLEKTFKVRRLENNGSIKVDGDLSGEQIYSNGMIECSGLLNCENLELRLSGVSHVHEIGATTIKVEEGNSGVGGLLSFLIPKRYKNNQLVVTTIEGDEIYLENCEVEVVRGKHITIGPNCNIKTIEYIETLAVDDKSIVKNSMRQ